MKLVIDLRETSPPEGTVKGSTSNGGDKGNFYGWLELLAVLAGAMEGKGQR